MAVCIKCGQEWPLAEKRCPRDGTPLLPDRAHGPPSRGEGTPVLPPVCAAPDDLRIGDRVGEYQLGQELGRGSMSVVYRAKHTVIDKEVAIKVLKLHVCSDPDQVQRFVNEARIVNRIGHPNIVDIFGLGTLDTGQSYIVMELLKGETILARLRRELPSLGEASEIVRQIVDPLQAAHDAGVVHRDLKPANVMLTAGRGRDLTAKILDFGIAKLLDGEAASDLGRPRTLTGVVLGSPGYLSPEQICSRPVDHRSDIYSLGVIAFELFTGRQPFPARSFVEILRKHSEEAPPRPRDIVPELPVQLDDVVLQMLEKEPERRPTLVEVLQVLDVLGGASARDSPTAEARPPVRRAARAPAERRVDQLAATQRVRAREAALTTSPVPPRWRQRVPVVVGASAAFVCILALVIFALARPSRIGESASASPSSAVPPGSLGGAATPLVEDSGAEPEPGRSPPTTLAPSADAVAILRVTTNVNNATVVVDGEVVATQIGGVEVTFDAAGPHDLEVSAKGHRSFHTTVDVPRGETQEMAVKLSPKRQLRPRRRPPASASQKATQPEKKTYDYLLEPRGATPRHR